MPKKLSFKQQMLKKREEEIIQLASHLLATKGYEAMTVDEIAEEIGISKPSLYRHFASKQDLAVGALLDLIASTKVQIKVLNDNEKLSSLDKLKYLAQWAMRLKLANQMPGIPSENSKLTQHLKSSHQYIDGLVEVSDLLGAWIEDAKSQNMLSNTLPSIVILYTLYARACDPVLSFLKQGGVFSDEQIIDMVTKTCFEGLI